MTNFKSHIQVEVVYAGPNKQYLKAVILRLNSLKDSKTVRDAIEQSGILDASLEIEDWENQLGIFGERTSPDTIINDGDRIEIYRKLIRSPKEARVERVKQAKKAIAREKSKPKIKKIQK